MRVVVVRLAYLSRIYDCTVCRVYQAVERLNVKPRYFHDLLTDAPFQRKDIVTLQDPTHPEKSDVSSFHHIRHNLAVTDEGRPDR